VILLFTDFGADGPYLGQVEAVLRTLAPGMPVINLLSDAPVGDPRLSSHLLAALARFQPENTVFLCVVDPGVGGARMPVVLQADSRWFVGPDNGLLNGVAALATTTRWRVIDWRPARLSASFHGRDLFAPVAARIARGDWDWPGHDWIGPELAAWPVDLAEVVYCDHYGNALTGLRYHAELDGRVLRVNGTRVPQARTFCAVARGTAFWYRNSIDLVEIAVNGGRAERELGLSPGVPVRFEDD
jgi:S-adenosylmethionine hydrolase